MACLQCSHTLHSGIDGKPHHHNNIIDTVLTLQEGSFVYFSLTGSANTASGLLAEVCESTGVDTTKLRHGSDCNWIMTCMS